MRIGAKQVRPSAASCEPRARVSANQGGEVMADLKTITVNWDEQDRPVITVSYGNDGATGGMQADADEWLATLAVRVSDNGAQFLTEMLKANEAHEFISFVDLAAE